MTSTRSAASRAIPLAALGILALLAVSPLAPGRDEPPAQDRGDAIPTLTVTGAAQLDVPPDEVNLVLSVVSEGVEGVTAREVMNENSAKAESVMSALRAMGLGEKEVTTSRFNVSPRYSSATRRGEAPRIVGYRVENEVRVKTKRIEMAGELIQTGVDAGANQVSSITFGLSDERARRSDVIAKATDAARADAKALAAAAGVRLVRTVRIDLDQPQFSAPQPPMFMRAQAEAAAAPPIQPGDVQVSARVTIVYEIEDLEKRAAVGADADGPLTP